MTTELHNAVLHLIGILEDGTFGRKTTVEAGLKALRDAYMNQLENLTETQRRVEFLRQELEGGVSKREAARRLCEADPKIGPRSAESLVYMNFSGQYQTSRRGTRLKRARGSSEVTRIEEIPDVTDDEGLI